MTQKTVGWGVWASGPPFFISGSLHLTALETWGQPFTVTHWSIPWGSGEMVSGSVGHPVHSGHAVARAWEGGGH